MELHSAEHDQPNHGGKYETANAAILVNVTDEDQMSCEAKFARVYTDKDLVPGHRRRTDRA